MTGHRDIEFSQIADDWNSATLGREVEPPLLLMRNGLTVKQNKEEGDLRVTRIETIADGFISEARVRFASGMSAEHVEKYRIRKGDILFSHINSDPHLGKTAIALKDYPDLLHGMNLLLLRVNKKILIPEFLHFLCRYYRVKGVFVKICSRSVNQSSINQAKLKNLEIPLPPLPEQRKIAGVLGVVQQAIEQQERLLALTAELKRALLHKLFTEGLRGEPQKQTEIGPVPDSWEVVKLGDLFQIKHGFAFDGKFFKPAGRYILLTPGHFFESGGFRDQGQKTKFYTGEFPRGYLLQKGELLVVMTEQKEGLLGSSVIVPESDRYLHNQRLGLIQDLDQARLSKDFLYYLFSTPAVRKRIFMTASGSKVRHTSPDKIRDVWVALPSLEEQHESVKALAAVDQKLAVTARKHAALTALFRTLMHQLMTAQIRVHDLDLEGLRAQAVAEMDSKS